MHFLLINIAKNCFPDPWPSLCYTLHWRHNERDGVSNHQPHDCLLNCLFRRKSKKISKLRVTGLCAWNAVYYCPGFRIGRVCTVTNISHQIFVQLRHKLCFAIISEIIKPTAHYRPSWKTCVIDWQSRGLVQERRNSCALAMDWRLSFI